MILLIGSFLSTKSSLLSFKKRACNFEHVFINSEKHSINAQEARFRPDNEQL